MIPHDPPPIERNPCTGAGPSECVDCGARCAAIVGYLEPRCEPCLRRQYALGYAQPSKRPVHDVIRLPAERHLLGVRTEATVAPAVAPGKIQIITPAVEIEDWRTVDRDRVTLAARRLATLAAEHGRRVRVTYALAHDIVKDVDIHSLCVRLWTVRTKARAGERFGYASYVNGRSSSCVLWRGREGGPRTCGVEEFTALALGREWTPPTPPPIGPCPRCQRPARWTTAGQPYGHNRPETKDRCPGLTV